MGLKRVDKSVREMTKHMIQTGHGSTEITASLGVSRGFVCTIARQLGIVMPRPGTKRETPTKVVTCDQCGKEFQRPVRVVRGEINRRGRTDIGQFCSAKCFRRSQGYSAHELGIIRRKYKSHSNLQIATEIGRSKHSVASMLHNLGLRRSDAGAGVERLLAKLKKEIERASKQ